MNKNIVIAAIVAIVLVGAAGAFLYYQNRPGATIKDDITSANVYNMTWGQILSMARGETVNFYMYGGDPNVDSYIQNQVTQEAANYGITLKPVFVTTASVFVNKIESDKQAGITSGGAVDLIWVNGANFLTLQQGNMLFGPWADILPNSVLVNWTDPSVSKDMGYPVNYYESPWGTAQFQMIYNSADFNVSELPQNYTQLLQWCEAHPGQFTYTAPPDFYGDTFIKAALYELTGGYQQYENPNITLSQFENMSAPLYSYLKALEPYLWDQGKTYPSNIDQLNQMFSNGQVSLTMTFDGAGIEPMIATGQLPSTAKVYCMNTSIANTNYVAIPYDAGSKAAAMVVANMLLDPNQQASWVQLTGNGPAIDASMLTGWRAADIANSTGTFPAGTFVSQSQMDMTKAPDLGGIVTYLDNLWEQEIGQ